MKNWRIADVAAFVFALGLVMPWMMLPLVHGLVTKRWSWWNRWLEATVRVGLADG